MQKSATLLELSRSDLTDFAGTDTASITDVKQLSSYNWIEAHSPKSPTIAIPGCPPTWSNIKSPKKLAKDCGHFYIAQNRARHPSSPLEPLFRAVYQVEPSFDIKPIDIVSDRNNFRKLLSFIDPLSQQYKCDSFTIKVEVVGNTALFNRDDSHIDETIGPSEFRGYGHNFERTYTRNEIQNSTGHHRIISYRFADLRVIIRHETDACISEDGPRIAQNNAGKDLAQMISHLSLSTTEGVSNRTQIDGSTMTLMSQGRSISREATLEIKTRSQRKPLAISDVAAQLWVSQTPKLVRAHHDNGVFPPPKVEDITSEIRQWEQDQQGKLKILAVLIRKIRDVTKRCSSRKTIIRYDEVQDRLIVFEGADNNMLPEDLYRKWDAPLESGQSEDIKPNDTDTLKELDISPTGRSSGKFSIVVGNESYESLPLHRMPSLASWLEGKRAQSPELSTFKHDEILLFPIAVTAINSGWRQILRQPEMGQVDKLKTLCSTFASLGVEVLEGKTLEQVILNIKASNNANEWDEDCVVNRSLARNAAFQLVFLLLQDQEGTLTGGKKPDPSRANKFYDATLYIAGHLRTFKYNTRRAVEAVYHHCQCPSAKQQAQLAKWSSDRDADELDATTSEESALDDDSLYFDSEYDS